MTKLDLHKRFQASADVEFAEAKYVRNGTEASFTMIFCDGMVDRKQINGIVLPRIHQALQENGDPPGQTLQQHLQILPVDASDSGKLEEYVFSGELLLVFPEEPFPLRVNISKQPQRTPEESSTEISIKGPRDAFTEDLAMNTALVRKRLKTAALHNERFTVGEHSRTAVSLLYFHDTADAAVVQEVRNRINGLGGKDLTTITQLDERLSGAPFALFPLVDTSGRPDFTAECLLKGRFAVLMEGSPMALIGPSNFYLLLKSPEDAHLPFYYVTLERLLRSVGLLMAVFLPGFYAAVSTFNLDQIPFPLLATVTSSRLGLPLSGSIDFFLMLLMFEVFREAGVRLPKAVGQTVAVVGGLIIGDAAIRAGITSPTTLVVTAVSTVSMFTLVNQSLVGAVSVMRIGVLLLSASFGMFGLILSALGLLLYLACLESFGVPYLAPLSPLHLKEVPYALLALPWFKRKKKSALYSTKPGGGGGKP